VLLDLEDEMSDWRGLSAAQEGISVDALIRRILHERCTEYRMQTAEAMLGVIGLWKDRDDIADGDSLVRSLRVAGAQPDAVERI
jgi:hypothetical protein